jgi:effector-binding domain-containing protein
MIDEPELIQTAEQMTAVIHLTVARSEIVRFMDAAMHELGAVLKAQDIAPAGPCFSFHLRRPTDSFDCEVGFPVATTITPTGRVKQGSLPAARVVRTVYRGGYEGLGAGWAEFLAWIDARGLRTQGTLWESYVAGPESGADPDTWRTELNRPLLV